MYVVLVIKYWASLLFDIMKKYSPLKNIFFKGSKIFRVKVRVFVETAHNIDGMLNNDALIVEVQLLPILVEQIVFGKLLIENINQ